MRSRLRCLLKSAKGSELEIFLVWELAEPFIDMVEIHLFTIKMRFGVSAQMWF